MYISSFVFGFVLFISSSIALSLPSASSNDQNRNHPFSSSHLVHEFPNETWVENIRVRQNGQILVSLVTSPDLYLIDPSVSSQNPNSISTATLVHSFPKHGTLGITEVHPDQFYVIAGNFSLSPLSLGNGTFSVYSVDLRNYDSTSNAGATFAEIAFYPNGGLLNGMDTLDASRNLVVISDSSLGQIWILDVATGNTSVLLKEPEFAPTASGGLGANGLKVLHCGETAYLYFSTQGSALFGRVPISYSTLEKTGLVEILSNGTVVDDFVLDAEKGVAYMAASDLNALISIPLDGGAIETVFGGANETVLEGPTAAFLGKGAEGKGFVYVTTNGGLEEAHDIVGGKVEAVQIK